MRYSTTCTECRRPIGWLELVSSSGSPSGEYAWVDNSDLAGCVDPLRPENGIYPHVPLDDSAEFSG